MRRGGFTMIELLLSLGLFSLLLVGLLQLLDTSTNLWRRVEGRRAQTEVASALTARLERDLSTLEAGPEGDLLADWTLVDVDGNGLAGLPLARLRFVRRASPREVARLRTAQTEPAAEAPADAVELPDEPDPWVRVDRGLVEVAWALVPTGGQPFRGELLRAERFLGDPERLSLFDSRLFTAKGRPVPGIFEELSGGVLWMEMAFATPLTLTDPSGDGSERWQVGDRPTDGASSWDAWLRERPNLELTALNEAGAGMPPEVDRPALPRRVRIAFEVESERDAQRRTSLAEPLEYDATSLVVRDGRRLPEPGGLFLIDEEWLELRSVSGEHVAVRRAQRGTTAVPHPSGSPLHFGWRSEVELPIGQAREDWNL